MAAFRAIGFGAALGLAAPLPSAAQVVDLYGVTEATLQWSAASGPVTGYYVIVARNGGAPALYGVSTDTREAVKAAAGDTVTVQVAAFDGSGVAGPVSAASSAIRFNALPGGGTGGTPTQPPADPDTDPTPDPDPDPDEGPELPGETPDSGPAIAVRLDYTGDGFSDLLLRNPTSGALTLWAMQGAQVLQSGGIAHLPYPWIAEGAGDFDGDGNSDILWRNDTTGQLILWLMRAGKVAGGGGVALPGFKITRSWKVDGVGDFDGDGREDVAVAHRTQGLVEILLMNGSTLVSRATRKAPSPDWQLVATPDSDGDGVSELVWRNNSTYEVRIESLAAPGQTHALLPARTPWRLLGSGDVDGDGRGDLLLRDRTDRIQPLLLTGARGTLASFGGVSPDRPDWSFEGLGDFDGDGRADPFWSHDTEPVQIWFSAARGFTPARVSSSNVGMIAVGEDED
jgi:hypothetical protein